MNSSIDGPVMVRQYAIITGNYWGFTLTDGALRMLVVLYFYQLGYSPLSIALLFLFYEVFGVVTNLLGGWLGARVGLNRTMNIGLFMQLVALSLLLVPTNYLSVVWVMAAQALSGIAKDLNKMSAKSAIKLLIPSNQSNRLFKWVAFLTGSKNTLKGVGFFLGAVLLSQFGFRGAILGMLIALSLIWLISLISLKQDLGRTTSTPKFSQLFSKSGMINYLSAARMFLFGARDVWFVVALPVFLSSELEWPHTVVGGFLALWVIVYGIVQSFAPRLVSVDSASSANGRAALFWALVLTIIPLGIAIGLMRSWPTTELLVVGLLAFAVVFAINSALHSYLIVHLASSEGVSLDVGFYYMANAMGRLGGTVFSGALFQAYGMAACLLASSVFVLTAAILSLGLDKSGT